MQGVVAQISRAILDEFQIELEFRNVSFWEGRKNRSTRRKNSRSKDENCKQQTQPTYDARVRELNPGHIGGRQALSPLRHPCSHGHKIRSWKVTDHMIGQKRREICVLCRSVFWRSWMKADKAGSKFQPALWMKEHTFRKMSMVITSGIWYRLDTSSEKFLIFVLSG